MKVIYPDQAPALPNAKSLRANLVYRTEHAEVIHLSLDKGESVARHTTPVDVFFLVLEGTGRFDIGDEQAEASREALVDSPAGIPHAITNVGEGTLRFLVVKVPAPK